MNSNGTGICDKVMWSPIGSEELCKLRQFMKFVNSRLGLNHENYQSLYKWSITEISQFWECFFEFSEIRHSSKYKKVVDESAPMNSVPTWFDGCKLNFAENVLRYSEDKIALYGKREGDSGVQTRTWAELRQNVARLSTALRAMEVGPGDRVVGYMPNCIEAVEAMLATSAVGAVWSSTSPDFGIGGVLDRFKQIEPVVLFTVNAVVYNGKIHDHADKVKGVVAGLPCLRRTVVLPFISEAPFDVEGLPNCCSWESFMGNKDCPLEFTQLPFSHPLFIMYSSGTTGAPKCMVHGAGGTLLTHLKEHLLHCDLGPPDLLIYYTTTGWMMWNWTLSALACGTAVVCYDGSPLRPHDAMMWDLIDQMKITVLGTSAKWLAVMEDRGIKPMATHDLRSLRLILSTGSPLRPSSYDHVYGHVKKDVQLASITGGTDIIGCFAGGNPMLPVYRGELQCPLLGMAIETWDSEGNRVFDSSGELVCVRPFPSMPTKFWNDKDGSKYQNAYFGKYPSIWWHGDFCLRNSKTGGIVMLGRSDGTLNPNGVRFGSSEIYNIVEKIPSVLDSLCVGRLDRTTGEEEVILFLRIDPKSGGDGAKGESGLERRRCPKEMEQQIRKAIRESLSVRHVPSKILLVDDIPYTLSGKKVEVAVRHILEGRPQCANKTSLMNAEALDQFAEMSGEI